MALAAGAYGYTTKRDLSGMGGFLFIGLLGVIVASMVGIFVQAPLLYIGISAVAAMLFTGFLVFDLNRVARMRGATEGTAILLAVERLSRHRQPVPGAAAHLRLRRGRDELQGLGLTAVARRAFGMASSRRTGSNYSRKKQSGRSI